MTRPTSPVGFALRARARVAADAWIAAVLIAAGSIGTASADDVQVNAYTTGDQRYPALAVDAEGAAVVVWESDGSSGTDRSEISVQGQLYAADGTPVAGEFQVNTYTTSDQRLPSVARQASGEFIVVWSSAGSSGTDDGSSVLGQRYAADGSPVAGEFQANAYTTGGQGSASVAVDADGDFVVVWVSSESAGTDQYGLSVQGRRFASSGAPAGGQFQINTYTTFNQTLPEVATADAGEFVVVWRTRVDTPSYYIYYNIHAQRYASDGSPAGPNFAVNSYSTANQSSPSVAMDPAGNFIVVWSDYYVFGQRYAADGSPVGDQIQVDPDEWLDRNPSVAMSADGEFVVVWADNDPYAPDTWGLKIEARRYNSFGTSSVGPYQINAYTSDHQRNPVVAMGAAGDFVVVWESEASGGTDADGFSIQSTGDRIFADGFESGDTRAWE